MQRRETADLLLIIQDVWPEFDPGDRALNVWYAVLAPFTATACFDAVTAYAAGNKFAPKPVEIKELAAGIDGVAAAVAAHGEPSPTLAIYAEIDDEGNVNRLSEPVEVNRQEYKARFWERVSRSEHAPVFVDAGLISPARQFAEMAALALGTEVIDDGDDDA